MNIKTPVRSLSRLDWFVSLIIITLERCEEIRIFQEQVQIFGGQLDSNYQI